ncbi:MAG TPA: tetratricopeptide repeat protein, partial [Candidatus Hydrogenedentes bacterium]|nr:tetratricopeptide repeat protein [Candidatus Hydrogenedentota bacterium]
FWAPVLVLCFVPPATTAVWQRHRVKGIADHLRTIERTPVPTETEVYGNWTLFRPQSWSVDLPNARDMAIAPFRCRYCAVEMASPVKDNVFWIMYEGGDLFIDFSTPVHSNRVLALDCDFLYFFPVFEATNAPIRERWSRFAGIALPKDAAHLFRGLYMVDDPRQSPAMLSFAVPAVPKALKTRQRMDFLASPWPSIETLTALIPGSPEYDARMACAQIVLGHPDAAIERLTAQTGTAPDTFMRHMALGMALEETAHSDEALQEYTAAWDQAPDFYAPYNAIVDWFRCYGTPAEAVEFWMDAAQRHADAFRVYRWLGRAWEEAGRRTDALAAYGAASELAPDNPQVLYDYVPLLLDSDRVEEAQLLCTRALDAHPRHPVVLTLNGRIAERECRYDDARDWYLRAIEASPHVYRSAYVYLDLIIENRFEEQAVPLWRALVGRYPNAHMAYLGLGKALSRAGKNAEAISALRKAIALSPEDTEAHICLHELLRAGEPLSR